MQRLVLSSLLLAFVTAGAHAAPPPNRLEKRKGKAEIREDRRELRNDRWDKARLESLAKRYREASVRPVKGKIALLDNEFLAEMKLELHESNVEVAEKRAEVRDSKGEVQKERRQLGRNIVKGQPVRAVKNSVDLADDKRDLNDDRRDRAVEVAHRSEKQDLHKRFVALRGQVTPAPLAEKLGIIEAALNLARKEAVGDVKELREDKRELREDRRDVR